MLKSVIYLTLLCITNVVVCAPDYLFNEDVNGWLKLHKVPATWQDAFLNCHYEGAVLASPINTQLATALRSLMRRSELDLGSIYIGANALFSQGNYISIEGVPLDDMALKLDTYTIGGKPEDCLRLSANEVTYTTSCTQWLPYICYKKREDALQLNECGTFDKGYRYHTATGSCYKLHEEPRTWNMAHKICAAEGGYLIIINDKNEAGVVIDMYPKNDHDENQIESLKWEWEPMHIGLRDWNKDNFTWLTIHGEKIENVYNTWAAGQPDNIGKNVCGCVLRDGTLDETWCTLELMFICEKDPDTLRFESVPTQHWDFPRRRID